MLFLRDVSYYRDSYQDKYYGVSSLELALNYMNKKNIRYQVLVKSCISIEKLHLHRKPYKLAETILISPLETKDDNWC